MPAVVRATISASDIALAETFSSLPDLYVEAERIVMGGRELSMPVLWVRNVGPDRFTACCEDDPTVDDIDVLAEFDDECLVRVQWNTQVGLRLQMLTNGAAAVLNAVGSDEFWQFRLLYSSREHLTATMTFCAEHEVEVMIDAVHELEGNPASRYGLTSTQYETLVTAATLGYFEVPRNVTLEELATELGISHQSISECLRRGLGALVKETLVTESTARTD